MSTIDMSTKKKKKKVKEKTHLTFKPSVQPNKVPKRAGLDHPSMYFNNELSWIDFNWRVFYQVLDERIPLLERVRFIAITANNLDEFVQKRVGGLKRQHAAGVISLSPDGRSPFKQLILVSQALSRLHREMTSVWEKQMKPMLQENANINICNYDDLAKSEKQKAFQYFAEHIYPILTPLAVDSGHPFPFISNLSLNLAITMRHPKSGTEHFARVKVPDSHGRWFFLSEGETYKVIPIEQIIAHHVDILFRGMDVESVYPFRITRNADVRRDEEEAEDLLAMISEELRERRFAPVVRLEVDRRMPKSVKQLLVRELELIDTDVYSVDGTICLADCFAIADFDRPELKFKPWEPAIPKVFRFGGELPEESDIFSLIRKSDILVYHPYDSFTASVQRFVEEAASDPKVIAIKQTLYRTSKGSPIVNALMRAAESGKQVAVLVEVKARFDEAKNIEFGQMLEDSGVHVTYGLVGLKTHCKVTLVIREEQDGPRVYCHIGTGNYHAMTARLYTDFGLFTCAPDFGRDVVNLFHYLTGLAPEQSYERLIVAPKDMRKSFYELIEREIANQKKYGDGRLFCKMNALDDIGMIKALYKASKAGVQIDLIIRGHCRLRPGLPGFSENIRVRSIIGRFLEHDRVYYFYNHGDPSVWFGSADWRRRNLDDRIEAIAPVDDKNIRKRMIRTLEYALKDNRLAWKLDSDGNYLRQYSKESEKEYNFHQILMDESQKH